MKFIKLCGAYVVMFAMLIGILMVELAVAGFMLIGSFVAWAFYVVRAR